MIEVAERQWGVLSRAQLAECGLGDGAIARWAERGRLQRLLPGVYALGHRALPQAGRLAAALLYAGPGAALGDGTAVWWWGFAATPPSAIHVVSPRRRGSVGPVRIHRSATIERIRVRQLPVIPVERALLHLAATAPRRVLLRALADADYRRLVQPPALEAALGRGRPGSAALRSALAEHLPELAATRSVLEERFLFLCRHHRIPTPEVNVHVGRFLVDALWRVERVVVELDGHAAHDAAAAVERDRARELELRAEGFAALRYTWRQVTQGPERVAKDLAAALAGAVYPCVPELPRRGAGVVERGGLENR
ncbi:MAG: type IV toxin-antitoxin system AbiEi family antitoxin domain-containing protein, partial [Thermoleophilaceae bacterium]|nr:type IV toxin-antitoxin system AbiEi family antitoxin domain-containing protein [Thermoleophilaceae bacterium]